MSEDTSTSPAPLDLDLERSIYIGNAFSLILYGLSLYMYGHSVYYLTKSKGGSHRVRRFYVLYGGIMMLLITFAVSCNAVFGQQMWINHRGDEGGPLGYFAANISAWYNTLGSAADITVNFMGDGLLLYRCYIIWGARPWVIALPALVYIASTVTAIITVYSSARPDASIFAGNAAKFGVAWVSLTVSLNIILTLMICARLIMARTQSKYRLHPRLATMYTGMVPILVESALPFTVLGVAFIAVYVRTLPSELALAFIWGTFCAISPQMIILRVSMGHGWARNTMVQLTNTDAGGLVDAGGAMDGAIGLDTVKNDPSIRSRMSGSGAV
jgi:hypothetical protein